MRFLIVFLREFFWPSTPCPALTGQVGCDAAIGTIGAIISVASTAYAAAAQSQAASYQSDVAKNNAKSAGWQADDAARRGEIDRSRLSIRNAQMIAAQTASVGASGIQLGSGSPEKVLEYNRGVAADDISMARYNSQMEEWGFRNQQTNYRAQAGLYGAESTSALVAGGLNAGSSLLASANQQGWLKPAPTGYGYGNSGMAGVFGGGK
ncbi:MAG: hypothetical protein WCS70_09070 [Verrucomicrobiota bacterium]